jgi:hypothetical protein
MKIVSLTFNFQLHSGNIRGFRAAIVETLGLGHHLFHGHDNSEPGVIKYSNAYPLIRFCIHHGRPRIMGMGDGADAVQRHLLPALPDTLYIQGETYDCSDFELERDQWQPSLSGEFQTFYLYQWIALNKKNYNLWKVTEGEPYVRRALLDQAVTGHLRALAENTDLTIDRNQIVAKVMRQDRVKKISWHGTQLIGFDVQVMANFIPHLDLGIGRCHSFGFGEVCTENTYNKLTKSKVRKEAKKVGATKLQREQTVFVESLLDLL